MMIEFDCHIISDEYHSVANDSELECHMLCLLSAQCISSIGQIIKSVCVSVSEWVSQSFM